MWLAKGVIQTCDISVFQAELTASAEVLIADYLSGG